MSHHSHSHNNCCEHEHDHDPESGVDDGWSLYKYINTQQLTCLNELIPGSVKNCFKPHESRSSTTEWLDSNDDEQLIIQIPFTGVVKLTNICVVGGSNGSSPSKLKVWRNKDDIDFSVVDDLVPDQKWELVEDPRGEITYTTKIYKFQNVATLTLYFSKNFGAETTRIYYIGLKGEFTPLRREAVNVVYEAQAQPSDHKTKSENNALSKDIS